MIDKSWSIDCRCPLDNLQSSVASVNDENNQPTDRPTIREILSNVERSPKNFFLMQIIPLNQATFRLVINHSLPSFTLLISLLTCNFLLRISPSAMLPQLTLLFNRCRPSSTMPCQRILLFNRSPPSPTIQHRPVLLFRRYPMSSTLWCRMRKSQRWNEREWSTDLMAKVWHQWTLYWKWMKKKIKRRNAQHQKTELLAKGRLRSLGFRIRCGGIAEQMKQTIITLSRKKQPAELSNQPDTNQIQSNSTIHINDNLPSNSVFPNYPHWPTTSFTHSQYSQSQQYSYSSYQLQGFVGPDQQSMSSSNYYTLSCYRCSAMLTPGVQNFSSCSSCPRIYCFTCIHTYYDPMRFTCESCYLNNTLRITQLWTSFSFF